MSSRDLMNHIHPVPAIAPQVGADDTPMVSAIIDTAGFESATFLIQTGVLADADATFTVLLEDGDDAALADAAAVIDDHLVGTEALAGFTFADDGECRKLGYIGGKRYLRLTITPANNLGNAPLSAMALLGHPLNSPTNNPPQ